MSRLNFILIGSSGRMGESFKTLLKTDQELSNKFNLVAEVNRQSKPGLEDLKKASAQVAIDFSQPELTLEYAPILAQLKIPHLVATTGFSTEQIEELKKIHQGKTPWLLAPNTSYGVHLMKKGIKHLLKDLSKKGFVAYLYDTHHRFKKDAPSGTALSLAASVKEADPSLSLDVHAARGGNEIGEHRLVLLGPGERIEIKHQASDRSLFAYGAFQLAQKLVSLAPQAVPYRVEDVF